MTKEKDNPLPMEIINLYEQIYNEYSNEVDMIINNNITDHNIIENTLNKILSINTNKGFDLYMKLWLYYSNIALEKSFICLSHAKKERQKDFDEYVKKLEKTK